MVLLITDITAARGFWLIQARARVIWQQPHLGPVSSCPVHLAQWLGRSARGWRERLQGRGSRAGQPDGHGSEFQLFSASFSLWVHGFP